MFNQLAPGSLFDGRFVIIESIGAGGMGLVYKARQSGLERLVVLKLLNPARQFENEDRIRFKREAEILSKLLHPLIASFYGLFNCDGIDYICMEYVEGESLRQRLRRDGALDIESVLSLGMRLSEALSYAHSAGVVHRDIKPENILLPAAASTKSVKIIDFGLSKLTDPDGKTLGQKLTGTGLLIGSVHYLSPELCSGSKIDLRADIYSLGCVLYEALSGSPPFTADNPIAVVQKHALEAVAPLRFMPGLKNLPDVLERVILRALAKQPADRYQSAEELRADLELVSKGQYEELFNRLPPAPDAVSKKRAPLTAVVTGLVLVILLFSWLIETVRSNRAVDERISFKERSADLRAEGAIVKRQPGFKQAAEQKVEAVGAVYWGNLAGKLASKPGREDECISAACKAIKAADKTNPELWAFIGKYFRSLEKVFGRQGNKQAFFECYQRRMFFDSLVERAYNDPQQEAAFLGNIFFVLSDYDRACRAYEKAFEPFIKKGGHSDLVSASANCGRACALVMLDRKAEALECFRQGVAGFERVKGSELSGEKKQDLNDLFISLHLLLQRRGADGLEDFAPSFLRLARIAEEENALTTGKSAELSGSSAYAYELLSMTLPALKREQRSPALLPDYEKMLRRLSKFGTEGVSKKSICERAILDPAYVPGSSALSGSKQPKNLEEPE